MAGTQKDPKTLALKAVEDARTAADKSAAMLERTETTLRQATTAVENARRAHEANVAILEYAQEHPLLREDVPAQQDPNPEPVVVPPVEA